MEWQKIDSVPKNKYVVLFLGNLSKNNVLYKDYQYRTAIWCDDHWSAPNEWIGKDLPTHWIPLPEPPKED